MYDLAIYPQISIILTNSFFKMSCRGIKKTSLFIEKPADFGIFAQTVFLSSPATKNIDIF